MQNSCNSQLTFSYLNKPSTAHNTNLVERWETGLILFAYYMMNAMVCFPLHISSWTEPNGNCKYSSICAVCLHLYACKNTIFLILISHLSPGYFSNKYELALERTCGVQSPTGTTFFSNRLQHASCPLIHKVSCTLVITVIFLRK